VLVSSRASSAGRLLGQQPPQDRPDVANQPLQAVDDFYNGLVAGDFVYLVNFVTERESRKLA
jgi:hypothetical protein